MCTIRKPIIDVNETAARIKSFRIKYGFTVREIQSIFCFDYPQAIYNWESGRDVPSIDNLIVLASVYGISIDQLIVTKFVEVECEMPEKKSA